jgi:molybdate transport system substrate-binding protein
MNVKRLELASSFLFAALLTAATHAAEIRVLSPNALHHVVEAVTGEFEKSSGHKVVRDYANAGQISKRVSAGDPPDVVITTAPFIAALVKEGKIQAGSETSIAKIGVGLVMRAGAPKPRVISTEDLKNALLKATTVTYADPAAGGAAGTYVAALIQKLGIEEQLKPRLRLGKGGDVAVVTLKQGEGAIGMTQISEIIGKPGAQFVGPLPEEVQNYTNFIAGVGASSKQASAAAAFIKFLRGPSANAAMKSIGIQGG